GTAQRLPLVRVGQMKEALRSVAFSPDGKTMVVGGQVTLNEGSTWTAFHLIDAETAKVLRRVEGSKQKPGAKKAVEPAAPVAYSPDGRTGAGGSPAGEVVFEQGKVQTKNRPVTALQFLPDGKTVVSAGPDGAINFIRVSDRAVIARLTRQGKVQALAVSPDG